jgi:arylsulfatase A-like enzyme
MNQILLTIDCLRADHLSRLGYSKKTTPNLDNLAGDGALFTQAISVGTNTPTSFKAMFTSTYPLMHEGQLYITESVTTLAQVLKEHGYSTAAFHFAPWLSSHNGYVKGFDAFDDGIQKWRVESWLSRPKELVKRAIGKNVRLYQFLAQIYAVRLAISFKAEVLNEKAISWLSGNPNNFFLWIHYMDVHEPYLPSSKLTAALKSYHILKLHKKAIYSPDSLSPGEVSKLVDLYDAKISHVDEIIGSLLRTLRQRNVLDDTFVIVTADHGQQFMEHGGHGHSGSPYDELIRVPLIIVGPGLKTKVISQQISLLDLAPTILDMLKVEKPKAFLGNSLIPLIKGDKVKAGNSEAISETAFGRPIRTRRGIKPRLDINHRQISLRTCKWKYIYTEVGQDELYDLEGDPGEKKNIIDIKPGIATELRAKIMAHIEFEEKSAPSEQERVKARIRRLKAGGKL